MMKYMAHIVDGKVTNVSRWDGDSAWTPAEEVVEIPTVEYADEETGETRYRATAGIGWDYVDGEFVDNRPVPEYDE
jgi:hypothetical protein